jgi:predicted ribosome quality control (RQC) complex YloA/Tae2 family protein
MEQFNNDRIILIENKEGRRKINIILEMFGRGNLYF